MTEFVDVKFEETGAVGRVPARALDYWKQRGYVEVDAAVETVDPPSEGQNEPDSGGSPQVTPPVVPLVEDAAETPVVDGKPNDTTEGANSETKPGRSRNAAGGSRD
jgi:hypothetical protein